MASVQVVAILVGTFAPTPSPTLAPTSAPTKIPTPAPTAATCTNSEKDADETDTDCEPLRVCGLLRF